MKDWINVKDKLPEYGKVVIICHKETRVGIGKRGHTNIEGEHWEIHCMDGCTYLGIGVTHWTPLNELPKK